MAPSIAASTGWAELLADLPSDWALIPLDGRKHPINPATGADADWTSPAAPDGCSVDDLADYDGNRHVRAIGVQTGPRSGGLLAVDFDGPEAAGAFQQQFGHAPLELPQTIGVTSGRRHRGQRFFTVDPDWWPFLANRKIWNGSNGKPCLELRWAGCQSVIAGEHPETAGYRWLPDASPTAIPDPAPAPDWLLEPLLIQESPEVPERQPQQGDAERAVSALAAIPAADHCSYDAWLRVGMALHHTSPGLLADWVAWSEGMPNFDESECLAKWESFEKSKHKGKPATIGTLIYLAKANGWKDPAPRLQVVEAQAPEQQQQVPEQQQVPQTFDERWSALEQYAADLARSEWPTVKALAALASRASELEITRLTQRNLEQLLEAAQRGLRATSAPILPGGTFEVNPTPWAVDGLFRHGLNLLVGQSGAGKSRLMASLMASWLRGAPTWLQRELQGPPVAARHALIIGTDQGREDWHQTLTPVGLCTLLPDGKTVQLHDRLTLYPMESGALLDADTMRMIRRWVDEHPGGMVAVDSLATCLPPGIDEDKSSAAGPVHALQDAISGGWGVLTHHTRKGAGKEGNLGVGAGRGSGAIDAAVSRVIGLGLIHRMEAGQLLPQESDPRRELLSTKRGGPPIHLIVASDASGAWDCHGSAEDLKRQQRQERVLENLTEQQREILAALEDNDGKTMTARDVVEALGHDWGDGTGKKPASIRRTMRTLASSGLLVCQKVGITLTFSLPDHAEG